MAESSVPPSPQGQGDATEFKQRGLYSAFWVNLNVWKHKLSWATYFHFDLNAGSGWNERAGCMGSPLAFLRAAADQGCERFFAGFVDEDEGACRTLLRRPAVVQQIEAGRAAVFHGDNTAFLDAIPDLMRHQGERRPEMALGTVLADPNGTDVPLEALLRLAGQCGKLDLIINWNSAAWKFSLAAERAGCKGFSGCVRLTEAVDLLKPHRKDWLIREPRDKWQWCLVIGRNIPVGEHRNLGFYRLDSERGQAILARCSYTPKELEDRNQGRLW